MTIGLLVILVVLARKDIAHAWQLLGRVNIAILLLMIPVQMIAYFAAGQMMFEYLRDKKELKKVRWYTGARMSLELNFVNHILPSGGVSGLSYMSWRLGKYGVSPARATIAQVVRYVAGFLAFLTLLLISVVAITLDAGVNRVIILVSTLLASFIIFGLLFGLYIISSASRMDSFAHTVTRFTNLVVRKVTFNRKRTIVPAGKIENFFGELHKDFLELRKEKKLLIKPFLWGLVYIGMDVAIFSIGFWALGHPVNPAPIVIAYGIASVAGFILLTPGGTGGYEALMISFLSTAGTPQGIAIAGVLLTRVILLLGTIASGYVFYQLALIRYGNHQIRR